MLILPKYSAAALLCLMSVAIAALVAGSQPARAQDRPGEFDYYVLALSWSPNWCNLEGRTKRSEQCDPGAGFGWVVHGLWPQYERGYPQNCQSAVRPPSRSMTARQADLFGSAGSAWYQWKKHGACSGLAPGDYYRLARDAYGRISRPEVFRKLDRDVTLPAALIEEAFLKANPDLTPQGVTVTCKSGAVQEVRVCLSRELEPRRCGVDIRRDCTLESAAFAPIE